MKICEGVEIEVEWEDSKQCLIKAGTLWVVLDLVERLKEVLLMCMKELATEQSDPGAD